MYVFYFLIIYLGFTNASTVTNHQIDDEKQD